MNIALDLTETDLNRNCKGQRFLLIFFESTLKTMTKSTSTEDVF